MNVKEYIEDYVRMYADHYDVPFKTAIAIIYGVEDIKSLWEIARFEEYLIKIAEEHGALYKLESLKDLAKMEMLKEEEEEEREELNESC